MPTTKAPKKKRIKAMSRRQQLDLSQKLAELEAIEAELQRRDNLTNPMVYGLPDVLFPKDRTVGTLNAATGEIDREPLATPETDDEYRTRQNFAIKRLIEIHLHFTKDGRQVDILLVPQQVEFISDFFFRRVTRGILWKGRGCGGSLCAAILIWLTMIYNCMSFIDLGGSMEQSRVVYEYVCAFWDAIPGMREGLLSKDPLLSMTKLITGVQLKCIPASEKMARGKHLPGLVADEACQDDPRSDTTFKAAMQMSMSEPEHMILLLSTFHHPVGLFQEVWDTAEAKGFKRYKWNCFDVMTECTVGLDEATPKDPEAREFCRTSCPLTLKEAVYDENDDLAGYQFVGCDGKGRDGDGFLPRENIINAMVLNEGTEIFRVEFACQRPQFSGPIYGLEAIENTLVESIEIDDANPTYVGIDWGVTEGALILGKDSPIDGPQVIASKFLSVKLMSEYIRILTEWQEEYGELEIYADSSHPFNIGDLEEAVFEVTPVDFATMKDYGISNLLKMFMYSKIRILDDNKHLIDQLKAYRRDPKTGKPIKFNDHGPDALLCMTVIIDFLERWGELMLARARGISRNQLQSTMAGLGLPSNSKVDEKSIDRGDGVMLF